MSDQSDFTAELSTDATRGPLYLFADSQMLFWKNRNQLLLETLREGLESEGPTAAYVGASNGDRREFYAIFEGAMDAAGFRDRRMIHSSFDEADREFLDRAQLIVLAGGDVHRGWSTFEKTGMKDRILARYAQGAVLVGISAGAVQLGRQAVVDKGDSAALELIDMFNLVPALVDVHDEQHDWSRLSNTVRTLEGATTGLGIPTGGGLVFHADGTAEPLRHPVHEFSWDGTRVEHSLLMPQ
jgi:peptidase E